MLLWHLLFLDTRNLTKPAKDNCLICSDHHDVKAIYDTLSSLYGRKLGLVRQLRRGADFLMKYALSPLNSEAHRLLGTPAQSKLIQEYKIVKIGRREFLIIGGAVMAAAVGGALYYVSPAFRALTMTVTGTATSTLTETKPIPVTTTVTESKTAKTTISTYRMTVSTTWYYKPAHIGQGYEMHFTTVRRGRIGEVRRTLASEGATYFQQTVYRRFGRWIPKGKLGIGFELEEPAARVQNNIAVQTRYMEHRGGRWKSTEMPSRVLSYARKA